MNSWILGGRQFYEILHANLDGAFPCPRTIETKLAEFDASVKEGVINAKLLKQYLCENGLPLIVSLAEDATAIVARREYSSSSNSVLGFSLPLQLNGLPDSDMAIVKDSQDIINMFEQYPRASTVIVVMAQPLQRNFPPLRICAFGSDNKFTAEDVTRRLNTIENELLKHGIKVLTYSADGDSRELKMMRQKIRLGVPLPRTNSKKAF